MAALCVFAWSIAWWGFTIDDAYIFYRYADNLSAGRGLVFNPGERIEGFSSPLWVLVLALGRSLGCDVVTLSKVLGLGCAVAMPYLLYLSLVDQCQNRWVPALAALWFVGVADLHLYACSGMETVPVAAALAAAVALVAQRSRSTLVCLATLTSLVLVLLSRPEGLALGPALWFIAWRQAPSPRTKFLLGTFPALAACLIAGRWLYFGALLPNTYLAKPSPLLHELRHGEGASALLHLADHLLTSEWGPLGLALRLGGLALVPLFLVGAVVQRRSALVQACLASCAVGVLYLGYCPPDWMPGLRFGFPFLLPAAIPCALGLDYLLSAGAPLPQRLSTAVAGLGLAVWLGTGMAEVAEWRLKFEQKRVNPALDATAYRDIGRWLADHASPEDSLLAYEIGAVGFESGLHVLDHEGLVNRQVARRMHRVGGSMGVRFGAPDQADTMQAVVKYCAQSKPDWFLTRSPVQRPLTIGRSLPGGVCTEAIQNALVQALGPSMVLAQRFPLGAGGKDSYLLLQRSAKP